MKKTLILFVLITLVIITVSGCAKDNDPLDKENPVELIMWHNYGGEMQKTMDTLIDEFNSTIGKSKGIIINVTAISSSSDLNKNLSMIVNGDPGAPNIPDIFTGYPKVAVQFQQKNLLCNLDSYFTEEELAAYVPAFIQEGRLSDNGLYVFPIAKSTEVLYLNQTLFDEFAAENNVNNSMLSTFEGLADLSKLYYEWTDAKTKDIPNDGKMFYTADSWFNVFEVGMEQLGSSIIDENNKLVQSGTEYERILGTLLSPSCQGGITYYNGYSSDLSKTGDLVCSTGSSAGILFYGDTITYEDGTVRDVTYSILPYPVFENGSSVALQRGGGLMVSASDKKKEYAAACFIKWLTASAQNMRFISQTGYLPVTKQAFEQDMQSHISSLTDSRIEKMLTAVLSMYKDYDFFTAPVFNEFDSISTSFESSFKETMVQLRNRYLDGVNSTVSDALSMMQ